MSTKIYNGYMLPNTSAFELNKIVNSLRSKVVNEAKRQITKAIGKQVVFIMDSIALDKDFEAKIKEYYDVDGKNIRGIHFSNTMGVYRFVTEMIQYKNKQIQITQERNPYYDFSFSLSVLPLKNKTLCIVYCDNGEMLKIIDNDSKFSEYGYWDNTDQPDGVSNREWRQRYNDWKKALNDFGAPSDNGMTAEFVFLDKIMWSFLCDEEGRKEILKQIPSLEERATEKAKDIIFRKEYAIRQKNAEPEDGIYFNVREYLKTEAGKEKIAKEIINVKKIIKHEFTYDDLKHELVLDKKKEKTLVN